MFLFKEHGSPETGSQDCFPATIVSFLEVPCRSFSCYSIHREGKRKVRKQADAEFADSTKWHIQLSTVTTCMYLFKSSAQLCVPQVWISLNPDSPRRDLEHPLRTPPKQLGL